MISARLARWRRFIEASFPERHIYIRAAGEMRSLVLSTSRQLAILGAACGFALWTTLTTFGMVAAAWSAQASIQQAQHAKAAFLQETRNVNAVYAGIIARHDAQLIATVDSLAQSRADRLRATLRQVGVDPAAAAEAAKAAPGAAAIDPKDPRLAVPVPPPSAQMTAPLLKAAHDVSEMRALATASAALPLAKPTATTPESSSYGRRKDPITGKPAFHAGLDFPAPVMTPVFATAPGVVTFTGERNGYGRIVEIDHAGGFKTRFAHLAAIDVGPGQKVAPHQRIGAIGSTGHSTGPHLHYEVWRNGRAVDPQRFLKAGDDVQQAG